MGGDLGNLLTGELGEAEARFSHEDFAGLYGRRIAQRVRRRRTVRAAGVGGGTMLTAGALAVGASNVPWGSLGVAPGGGRTDCVTPSPTDVVVDTMVTVDNSTGELVAAVEFEVEVVGGATALSVTFGPEGLPVFTDGEGNLLAALQDGEGRYVVSVDAETSVTVEAAAVRVAEAQAQVQEQAQALVTAQAQADAASGRLALTSVDGSDDSPSDDCYTPSPTPSVSATASAIATPSEGPSPDPTLAAKPEDVIGDSPFECGFQFPTESYGTDTLSIGGAAWLTPEEAVAAVELEQGAVAFAGLTTPTSDVASASALVMNAPRFEVNGVNIDVQTGEPRVDKTDHMVLTDSTDVGVSVGMTFVATKEGKVVATGTLPEGALGVDAPIVFGFGAAEGSSTDIYLMDAAEALSSCDANPVDLTNLELYAVAGSVVRYYDGTVDPAVYAWLPLTPR